MTGDGPTGGRRRPRRIVVVNGPNLNLLGTRDPATYGSMDLPSLEAACREWAAQLGLELDSSQSNHEGALVDRVQAARGTADGLVINPGALTHYSYSLHDAIEAVGLPAVETHISNVEEREPWRRVSVVRPACVATIYGRGVEGYRWAIRHLFHRWEWPAETVAYGDGPEQVLDLRRPQGPSRGTAVLVHGGFWRHQWTRDLMEGLAVDLARRGLTTANLEYRRVGRGGGWPDSLDDVVAGARQAAAMGGEPLLLVGHSAGGHLALLAGHRLAALGTPPLVVSMAGVTDLVAAVEDDLDAGAASAFLAGAPPTSASPIHLLPSPAPAILAHGEDDDRVPVEHSVRYAGAGAGELVVVPGGDHFGFLERSHPMWAAVVERIESRLAGG